MRPNWYEDEAKTPPQFTPLREWRGVDILMLVLVAVFVLQLMLHPLVRANLALGSVDLTHPLQYYRFLTYALVHDSGFLFHLLFNLLALFFFGRPVEAELGGRKAFFFFALGATLVSSLAFVVEQWFRAGDAWVLYGASGICYACLVAFATLYPRAQVVLFIFPMRAWALVALLMGIALFYALTGSGRGVADTAHFAGGVFGFLYIRYRHQLEGIRRRWRGRQVTEDRRRTVDQQREMDRILEKISETGLGSLTRSERKFLDSASRNLRQKR